MDRLLYDYDSQTNKISPLPASPLLLPAIVFLGIWYIGQKIYSLFRPRKPLNIIADRNVPPEMLRSYRKEYLEMMETKKSRDLTTLERIRLEHLKYPPWSFPGETWDYR